MSTTIQQVQTELAAMKGELQTMIAELRGDVQRLTEAIKADREAREKAEASITKAYEDHEARIRALENRRTVSPLGLWSVVIGAIGAFAGIAAIVNWLSG